MSTQASAVSDELCCPAAQCSDHIIPLLRQLHWLTDPEPIH